MGKEGAVEQSEEHMSWYAKIRTKLSIKGIQREQEGSFRDRITDEVIEEVNYWTDDYEISQGHEPGEIVRKRYVRRGDEIEMEEVEEENPFLKYRR